MCRICNKPCLGYDTLCFHIVCITININVKYSEVQFNLEQFYAVRKNIFACLFSDHNTLSL